MQTRGVSSRTDALLCVVMSFILSLEGWGSRADFVVATQVGPLHFVVECSDYSTKIFACGGQKLFARIERLPQLDLVAVGIVNPRKAAAAFVLPLRVDLDACFRQALE
jgi:hypothetical protein